MAIPCTESQPVLAVPIFLLAAATFAGLGLGLLSVLRVAPSPLPKGEGQGEGLPSSRPSQVFLLALATALGMAVSGLYVFALGLADLYPYLPWLLLPLPLLAAWPLWRFARQGGLGISAPPDAIGWLLTAFLAAAGLLSFLAALAPANANDWDGLSYHLAVPALYLRHGGLVCLPWLSHSNFPFLHEMLYTAGLGISGQGLAKLFHWLAGAVTALGLCALVRDRFGNRAGLLAAAVFAAIPLVAYEAISGMTDLALGMYLLLAAGSWLAWREGKGEPWLAAAGLLLGCALGVKVTAAVAAGLLGLMTVGLHRQVPGKTGLPARLALLALPAIVLAAPWYVKSYLWTGNPVYPFMFETFGGRWWNAAMAAGYRAEQLGFGLGHGPLDLLLAPWRLTTQPAAFSNFPDRPLIFNSLGPLLLGLAPAGLVLAWRQPLARLAGWFALAWLGSWFALSQHLRYFLPAAPLLAALAGIGAALLLERGSLPRLLTAAVLAVTLTLSLALQGLMQWQAACVPAGLLTPREYLAGTMPDYVAFETANERVAGGRLAMLGETRGLYLTADYVWGEHSTWTGLLAARSVEDVVAALHHRGITHLLIGPSFRRSMQEPAGLGALVAQAVRLQRLRVVEAIGPELLVEVVP